MRVVVHRVVQRQGSGVRLGARDLGLEIVDDVAGDGVEEDGERFFRALVVRQRLAAGCDLVRADRDVDFELPVTQDVGHVVAALVVVEVLPREAHVELVGDRPLYHGLLVRRVLGDEHVAVRRGEGGEYFAVVLQFLVARDRHLEVRDQIHRGTAEGRRVARVDGHVDGKPGRTGVVLLGGLGHARDAGLTNVD